MSRQRQIVADLEQSGHDATIAKARLQEAEETQAVYVAEANRLERELGGPYIGRVGTTAAASGPAMISASCPPTAL
jgi:hypothetical protein